MAKFRNKEKQLAYENYLGKNKHDLEEFNRVWARSRKNARGLYNSNKHDREFSNISERAKIFSIEEFNFGEHSINQMILNGSGSFAEKYENAERTVYDYRTNKFFSENGHMKYTDRTRPIKDEDGNPKKDEKGNIMYETKTLNEWFEYYQKEIRDENGKLIVDKDKMNDIIEDYKNLNPNRSEFYASSNPSDTAIQEFFSE